MNEPRYNKNRCEHGLRDVEGESQVEKRKVEEQGGMRRSFGKTLEDGDCLEAPHVDHDF